MFNWYAVLDNAKQRIAELENGISIVREGLQRAESEADKSMAQWILAPATVRAAGPRRAPWCAGRRRPLQSYVCDAATFRDPAGRGSYKVLEEGANVRPSPSKDAQRGRHFLALRLSSARQSDINCSAGRKQCWPLRTSSQDHAFAASTPQGDAGPVDPIAKRLPELRECHTSGEK